MTRMKAVSVRFSADNLDPSHWHLQFRWPSRACAICDAHPVEREVQVPPLQHVQEDYCSTSLLKDCSLVVSNLNREVTLT
mmetsp:Transcript_71539/g.232519  ORF Transcript_71539/g.232519 Transcript_71539/m.232519 type:complete len:80 (+) Transcript_71539:1585-1824(+)